MDLEKEIAIVINGLKDTISTILEADKETINVFLGIELEFYFLNQEHELNENSLEIISLYNDIINISDLIDEIVPEDGFNQFEIIFKKTKDYIKLSTDIIKIRNYISNNYQDITFQTFLNNFEPSNSMHFNISIYHNDINIFNKDNINDEYMSIFVYFAIAGLLETMQDAIYLLTPTDNCYERFKYSQLISKHKHYPTNCSWGLNNRTCAIRIPNINYKNIDTRIEYRIPSALCNPMYALYIIFYSINYGIKNELECSEPIFGDAFSYENDNLTELPKTKKLAYNLYKKGHFKNLLYN